MFSLLSKLISPFFLRKRVIDSLIKTVHSYIPNVMAKNVKLPTYSSKYSIFIGRQH